MSEQRYKYHEVMTIDAYQSSVWLIEFAAGQKKLMIWHKDAEIQNIVEAVKLQHPQPIQFTVAAVDVGSVWLHSIEHMMSNGRKLNQDMEVVV